jgi:type VI secretion system protein ImpK
MQLLSICEPLFQYVCKLTRCASGGCTKDLAAIQADIHRILKDARAAAARDPDLAAQLEAVLKPLVFFVDYRIRSSELGLGLPIAKERDWGPVPNAKERVGGPLPGGRQWQALAYSMFHELAGDEKFFCLLEQELQDRSEQATERLAVYHSCLGLGFRGLYANHPDQIKKYLSRTGARAAALVGDGEDAYLCPQAYQNTDERNLVEPPNRRLALIGLTFLILVAVWFVGSRSAFHAASREINAAFQGIQENREALAEQ